MALIGVVGFFEMFETPSVDGFISFSKCNFSYGYGSSSVYFFSMITGGDFSTCLVRWLISSYFETATDYWDFATEATSTYFGADFKSSTGGSFGYDSTGTDLASDLCYDFTSDLGYDFADFSYDFTSDLFSSSYSFCYFSIFWFSSSSSLYVILSSFYGDAILSRVSWLSF